MTIKQVPTVPGRFLLGSLHEFKNPLPFIDRLVREYDEIAHFKVAHFDFYLVLTPELVREVLVTKAADFPKDKRDNDILSKFIGRGLVTTNGETHKRQRKLAQPAFHTRRIEAYADTMVDYTERLTAVWQTNDERDISEAMYELTMYIVSKTLFDTGMDDMADRADLIGQAIHDLQAVTNDDFQRVVQWPEWMPLAHNRQRKAARAVLDETVNKLIAERRAGPFEDKGDLLSMFLQTQDEEGAYLTDTEVRDQLVTVFVAGHETTSNALSWTLYLLTQHPEVAERLRAEVDEVLHGRVPTLTDMRQLTYTQQVIKESMRLIPPVWTLSGRQAAHDVQIGDYLIPQGSVVMVSPWAMHHNHRYFADPQRFDPERFTPENEAEIPRYVYFPFGAGGRVCIGNSFAMMEATLILATLIQQFTFALVPGQTIEPNPQVTVSPKHGLRMRVSRREALDEVDSFPLADLIAV